jgi:thiamine kinase-like enzyme
MLEFLNNKIDVLDQVADLTRINNGSVHYLYYLKDQNIILKVRSNHASAFPEVSIDPMEIQKEIDILKAVDSINFENIKVPKLLQCEVNSASTSSWMAIESVGEAENFLNASSNKRLDNEDFYRLGKHFKNMHTMLNDNESLRNILNDFNKNNYFERYFEHKIGKISRNKKLYQGLSSKIPKVVHGDLTTKNLLFENNKISVIDWEYAHVGSIELELGIFLSSYFRGNGISKDNTSIASLIDGYNYNEETIDKEGRKTILKILNFAKAKP